jgi:hypothetical protein
MLYDKAREAFCKALIDLVNNTIKVILVDAGQYTVDLTTHEFLSDIPAGARVATSAALSGKSVAAGVFDASDLSFATVSGPTVEALVLFIDTGVAGTSRLLLYTTNFTVNGGAPPFIPNGGGLDLAWDNGANKIFRL